MGIAFSILVILTSLMSVGIGASVFNYHSSDAAGNGLTRAYTAIGAMVLWFLLGAVLVWSGIRGGLPGMRGVMAFALFVLAATAQVVTLRILDGLPNHASPELLLRLVVVISPLLILAYVVTNALAVAPGLQVAFPVALAVVSVIPWVAGAPVQEQRKDARAAVLKASEAAEAKLEEVRNLPDETPLATILGYTDGPGMFTTDLPEAARARIRKLPSKQQQAEAMLDAGSDLLLIQINCFDLRVTPSLCAAARKNLRRVAEAWAESNPDADTAVAARPYQRSERLIAPLRFLVRNGCGCQDEMAALEGALGRYPDSFEKGIFLKKTDSLRKGEDLE